jgi:hypothetical protein
MLSRAAVLEPEHLPTRRALDRLGAHSEERRN